jgi:histidyl-tRNA synthetase
LQYKKVTGYWILVHQTKTGVTLNWQLATETSRFVAFKFVMDKPSLPKGTRDFGPAQMAKRQYILDRIKTVFQKYGFQPLETPAMENLTTLTGKYGDEGDQLLFKILNSGDYLKDVDAAKLEAKRSKQLTTEISEKGLRYDLTVPFARYVVMNRHEITFPFKRYQIQPVWRADRPQKGRYREFYQCDADVVGTDSLLCEADIVLMITEVFSQLHIQDYTIKINHRGILSGLAEICGAKENEMPLFVAIDKLDKIGEEKVKEELRARGFQEESLTTLFQILNFKGNTQQKIDFLSAKFSASENGQKGLSDFQKVLELLNGYQFNPKHLEFDISLARGLSYYTGCIFEVKINNVAIGSVSGGGRYDNLTGSFGLEGVSGIGISFGVDRLYDAMEELKLFPSEAMISSTVMIAHFDNETMRYGLQVAARLRAAGVATELYPDVSKIKKQMEYANKKLIPYVIVIGADEMTDGQLTLKRMHTGEQKKKTLEEILLEIKK